MFAKLIQYNDPIVKLNSAYLMAKRSQVEDYRDSVESFKDFILNKQTAIFNMSLATAAEEEDVLLIKLLKDKILAGFLRPYVKIQDKSGEQKISFCIRQVNSKTLFNVTDPLFAYVLKDRWPNIPEQEIDDMLEIAQKAALLKTALNSQAPR